MIKRKPQEIADFFGCYVAMDVDGVWCAYSEKPQIDRIGDCWDGVYNYLCLEPEFIDIPANHDWTTLYEPAIKEKVKKLVPYDLSKKEDRDALRGKWVRYQDGEEYLIYGFYSVTDPKNPEQRIWRTCLGDADYLLDYYIFLDGSPVGKEVEE